MAPSLRCAEKSILVLLQIIFIVWKIMLIVRGDICALSSSDDVLAPLAVCGSSSKAFCASLTS